MNSVLDELCREHAEICHLLDRLVFDSQHRGSLALLPVICGKIHVHSLVEAGVLIPAIAAIEGGETLLRETGSNFAAVTALLNKLSSLTLADGRFAATLGDLHNSVLKHIQAAETAGGVIELASRLELDWPTIAKEMRERRRQLGESSPPALRGKQPPRAH